ncbi:hypothetical protein DFR49_2281 [Hephaestia caeni]|uniref:Uncharacterized protein n=1 Tax=Hephaestia caeni TaxID=645617 RepID=A0A397PA34_9SPHN|nr:hypothetical protein [Hephaestia caeni]RIA44045.1 hypothetical protein DFR49_2281 [Hephaestia caeni]
MKKIKDATPEAEMAEAETAAADAIETTETPPADAPPVAVEGIRPPGGGRWLRRGGKLIKQEG